MARFFWKKERGAASLFGDLLAYHPRVSPMARFLAGMACIVAVMVLAFGLMIYTSLRAVRKRNVILAALAERLRMRFVPAARWTVRGALHPGSFPDAFLRYSLRTPSPLCWSAHAEAGWGRATARLGHALDTSSDPASEVTFATADHPDLELPFLGVEPRGQNPRMLRPGRELVAFPEDGAFDQQFAVRGPEPAAIRGVLSDPLRRELLSRGPWSFETHRLSCCSGTTAFSKRWTPSACFKI